MNERRRTLLFSGGYKIPTENGVYIESVEHKFYLTDDWDTTNTANSIAVVGDECKFRISLHDVSSVIQMSSSYADPWETYLSGTTNSGITNATSARVDYNGAANTQLIVEKCNSSTKYAAGACNAYTFLDGVTKGYLPSLGELNLAYQNKIAINAALKKCGGVEFVSSWYWSSTFYGSYRYYRGCWELDLDNGDVRNSYLDSTRGVRAFGALENPN